MKSEWKKVPIESLCIGIYDGPHATPPRSDAGGVFLGISNFSNGRLDLSNIRYISEDDLPKWTKRVTPKAHDIVFSYEATLNLYAIIPEGFYGCLGRRMALVRPDESKVDYRFLYYYMYSSQWREEIERHKVNGSTVDRIPLISFPSFTVNLPSMATQKYIAEVLSVLDDKIKHNNKINDNLYEMVNAYYTSLFKESDCEMTTVGNYAERIYSGGTPMTSNAAYWNGTFGWFSSGETRNRFVISTEKTITQAGIDNSSTKLATKYDIVMASAGQGFTRGQTSMLLIDTYVNQSVIVIKSEKNILPYLFWNLANRYDELRAISDSSSIRGSLTTKMIAAFEIPLANEQSLQAFADFAWSVIPQIENNLLENERLTALRDSLLPKLMSGEIDVSDIQL